MHAVDQRGSRPRAARGVVGDPREDRRPSARGRVELGEQREASSDLLGVQPELVAAREQSEGRVEIGEAELQPERVARAEARRLSRPLAALEHPATRRGTAHAAVLMVARTFGSPRELARRAAVGAAPAAAAAAAVFATPFAASTAVVLAAVAAGVAGGGIGPVAGP